MHVAPYFPEPETVPGRVDREPYLVLLGFQRRVVVAHGLTALAVAVIAIWFPLRLSLEVAAWGFVGCLVALTLIRRLFHGGQADLVGSTVLLVPTVLAAGTTLHHLAGIGWPVWSLGASVVALWLYTALCGRDFSFTGLAVLGSGAIAVLALILNLAGRLEPGTAWFAWGLGTGFLIYLSYDLASLLSRRRLGEEASAAADLYRDLLNFLTYSVRIVLHWRKFRFI